MAYYSKQNVKMKDLRNEIVNAMKLNGWTEIKNAKSVVPTMTNNSMGNYTVGGVGYYSTTYHYYYAFDELRANYWRASSGTNSALQINFGSKEENKRIITGVAITTRNGDNTTLDAEAPKAFKLQASEDGSAWVDIEDVTDTGVWNYETRKSWKVTNTTAYRYYRALFYAAGQSSSTVSVGYMEFLEDLAGGSERYESIMTSTGTGGADKIVVTINPASILDETGYSDYLVGGQPSGNILELSIGDDYDTAIDSVVNKRAYPYYLGQSTTPYYNPVDTLFHLEIEVNPDRVFFSTTTDPVAQGAIVNSFYGGVMKRHSEETNSDANTIAIGTYAPTTQPYVLRNKMGEFGTYQNKWVSHSYGPSAWGDNIFLSPVFLEGTYEGIRGQLDDVFTARTENVMNHDEIVVGTTIYKAIVTTSWGSTQFPGTCIFIRKGSTTV